MMSHLSTPPPALYRAPMRSRDARISDDDAAALADERERGGSRVRG